MRPTLFLAIAALLAPSFAGAQNVTHTIKVTTSLDSQGNPAQCSLREAFENVNAAAQVGANSCGPPATLDGTATRITLADVPGGMVVLKSPVQQKRGEVVLHGGYVDGGATSALMEVIDASVHFYTDGAILQNAKSSGNGAALRVSGKANATLRRSVVRNASSTMGGGIYVDSTGTLATAQVSLVYNSASDGGALYVAKASSVDLQNTRIARNTAISAGGGAYFAKGFKVFITDSRIDENQVDKAGAAGGGGAIASYSWIDLLRTSLEGNRVESAAGGSMGGGALLVGTGNPLPVVRIRDSRFHANSAATGNDSGGGGAIRLHSVTFEIDDSTFSDNHSSGMGGGLMLDSPYPMILRNVTVAGNTAGGGDGAGIWMGLPPGSWAPDPNAPFGGYFRAEVVHSTLTENTGKNQFFAAAPTDDFKPVLFVNNVVHSEKGIAGCGGNTEKIYTRRLNDNSIKDPNLQYPGNSCGSNVPTMANTLGKLAKGWYFDMLYRPTISQEPADPVVCAHVQSLDQFDNIRDCLMGAVEQAPGPVVTPSQPWWL